MRKLLILLSLSLLIVGCGKEEVIEGIPIVETSSRAMYGTYNIPAEGCFGGSHTITYNGMNYKIANPTPTGFDQFMNGMLESTPDSTTYCEQHYLIEFNGVLGMADDVYGYVGSPGYMHNAIKLDNIKLSN